MTKASPDPDGPAPVLTPEARRVLARTPGQCLRHGLIQSLPFLLVLVPFGLLFGVVSDAARPASARKRAKAKAAE